MTSLAFPLKIGTQNRVRVSFSPVSVQDSINRSESASVHPQDTNPNPKPRREKNKAMLLAKAGARLPYPQTESNE